MKKLIVVLLMLCSGVFGLIGGLVLAKNLNANPPVEVASNAPPSKQESKEPTPQVQSASPAPPAAESTVVVEDKKPESQSKPSTEIKPSAPKQVTKKEKTSKEKATTKKEESSEFTYKMAIKKLEKEIGYYEDRVYTLVSKGSDRGTPAYTIRTALNAEGGSGTGLLYYVTKYNLKQID